MGILGRRKSVLATQATANRDVPKLNPTWFEDQLKHAGKPVTTHNAAAVAALTSANLALNAHVWLDVVGTSEIRRRWDRQFDGADEDYAAMLARPDNMIDFLWSVSPRLYPGLRDFLDTMVSTIQDRLRDFGAELPLDMWSSGE